jgi:hypothetical protein
MKPIDSQSISWFPVQIFADQLAAAHGIDIVADELPHPGTPRWCSLPDDDARKAAALLLSASREALRHETEQQARAEASKAVAGAADWPQVAREIRQRNDFRRTHPWAKRVSA